MMDRSEFLRLLKERLPELKRVVNQQEGLLHFEVDQLRKRAQRAIFDGDKVALDTCLRLAEEGYSKGDQTLKNAIDVSFIEGLDFLTPHNSYLWAWQMMPNPLKRLYEDFHGTSKIPKT